MDEDLAEMAALRKARGYQGHQSKYGDRGEARRREKEREIRREQERKARRDRALAQQAAAKEAQTAEDGATVVSTTASSSKGSSQGSMEEQDMMAMMGFAGFGAKKEKKSLADLHKKMARQSASTSSLQAASQAGAASSASKGSGLRGAVGSSDEKKRKSGAVEAAVTASQEVAAVSETGEMVNPYKLPITHEAVLKGHKKAISAMALDPSGSRLITGSYDYTVKMWNWAGMNESLRSFRSIEPEEGHQVRQLAFSATGDRFFCCTGSARPKVYDRDGFEKAHFVRGDMYLHDQRFVKGHVNCVTGGMWHPIKPDHVLTSAVDGTIRCWDVNKPTKSIKIIKFKTSFSHRAAVTACTYSPNGSIIAGAATDGSIHLWKANTSCARSFSKVKDAHLADTETSCLTFGSNNYTLLSRGGDHTLKVWDVRKFKKPVMVFEGLENNYAQTDVVFSPDEKLIVTGTSNIKEGGHGQLVFADLDKQKIVNRLNVTPKSVVRVLWHKGINQILAGTSDAKVHVLYSPEYSTKGVMLCVGRKAKKKDVTSLIQYHDIHTPHSLPMYRARPDAKRQKRMDRKNPVTSRMPEPPLEGRVGAGGRTQAVSINQFMIKQFIKKKIDTKDLDPREQLLKYAELTEKDPMFLGNAYRETQPKPVFQEMTPEEIAAENAASEQANKRLGNDSVI